MDRSPIQLDAVALIDRRRIDSLLTEAGRATDTPGVLHDLAVDVIAATRAHLDVLDLVLVGARTVDDGSDQAVREALIMYEATLEPVELARLRGAWARHGGAVDAAIEHVRREQGDRALARLGHDFSDLLDVHSYRRPRATTRVR